MRRVLLGGSTAVVEVALVTGAIGLLKSHVPVLSLAVLYLLAVLSAAIFSGLAYALAVSVGSMLAFNFFFLPPVYTLTMDDSRNWFALLVFVITSVVVSELAARSRRQARESALLARIATSLLEHGSVGDELDRIAAEAAEVLGVEQARIELGTADEGETAYPLTVAERRLGTIHVDGGRRGSARRLLPALASLLGVAIDRDRLAAEAFEAEALRRSDTMKTAILRAVSHDLRTPLMAILTSATALAEPDLDLDDADRADLLDTVLLESRRLDRLVANLLDLSRLQAGAADPDRRVTSVDELVVEALEGLGVAGARVQVSLPDEPLAVDVDAQQVQRALANLLENALKYSPADEPVSVRVSATSAEALLRVIDRGPGVPAAESDRIFSPFQRGSDHGATSGAGLGLAIAQGFAEANGGRVWVESHAGQGATFVLALPVVPAVVPA